MVLSSTDIYLKEHNQQFQQNSANIGKLSWKNGIFLRENLIMFGKVIRFLLVCFIISFLNFKCNVETFDVDFRIRNGELYANYMQSKILLKILLKIN